MASDDATVSSAGAAEEAAAALQRERDDLYDRLLRLTAEFDNYRKRTERERRELGEYLTADVVRDVLPTLDDLERALESPAWRADDPARRGVELIHRQLLGALRKRGVEPLDVLGQQFDPAWHEAVATEAAADRPDGQIVAEVRRGYRLGDRMLRPAMVRVARA